MFPYYVPGTVLGSGDTAVKEDKVYPFLKDETSHSL